MKNNYVLALTVILAGYWINVTGQTAPRPGDIVITEIMVNPEVVSDANGEWFEIWNSTNHDLLLNGLTLKDAGSNEHTVNSSVNLVFPAGSYWVLSKNGDIQTNGGVVVNYTFQNFTLSNTSDQIIINGANEVLIDQVSYNSSWPVVSGASMELHPDYQTSSGNDQPEHWLPAKIPFGAGDKGSPGKSNPVSSGLEEWEQEITLSVFPNPATGEFVLEATFPKPQCGEIRMINLLGQNFLYKTFPERLVLREIIKSGIMSPGIWFIQVISGGRNKTSRLLVEK